MNNGYIVATTVISPQPFNYGLSCLKWGGYAKDIKCRNTQNYQFSSVGSKKITIWTLDPYGGKLQSDIINTSPIVRDYTC